MTICRNVICRTGKVISLVMAILSPWALQAQEKIAMNSPLITIDANHQSLKEVLSVIEKQIPYKFAYNSELIAKHKNVRVAVENKPLEEVFPLLLKGTNITYSIFDNQIILNELPPPPQITISGYVKDSITGETLPGAIIYLPEKQSGMYANNYGFFSITQDQADSLDVLISYMGFHKIVKRISGRQNSSLTFLLSNKSVELNSVLITDKKGDDNLRKHPSGKSEVSMDRLKTMPSISGSGDIINSIQMMPGVIAGLDGKPGYFIRGGNNDQNLVQLDEATLYNPNHLLGLVGIFNSSAIKNAYLLKAGFPASFGDHLSSVLDVTMKEGSEREFNGDIQLGTISTGFTFSGPLIPEKASFFVAARRSTIDLMLKPFNVTDYYSNYHFYDVNTKLNFRLTPRDRIFISYYQGRDKSAYSRDTIGGNDINYHVNYGNQALTFRWNHLFSQKLFSNTSVTYNNYFHLVKARQKEYFAELYSGIRDMEIKTDFNYYPHINHSITAGVNYLYQTLFPASVTDKGFVSGSETTIDPEAIPQKFSHRIAAYFSDEIRLGPKLNAYIGARIPFFFTNKVNYLEFEPRVSLMYLVNPSSSIKVSYTEMHQYLHLAQSFNSSFPAQVWIGSSKLVKPQYGNETSLGFFKNFKQNTIHTSVELYYKKMGNQIMFRGGPTPEIKSDMENTLIFGEGESYGAEFFVEKSKGRLTGFAAYTLSYSFQQFDSLNMGKQFPFSNDRRHNLALSMSYSLNKHWEISSNFIFSSGSAFSLFKYISPNKWQYDNPLYYYSGSEDVEQRIPSTQIVQNNYRLDAYHRLDLSIRYRNSTTVVNRKVETEWVLSVYNVYARENTFFAYCSIDPVTKKPIAVQVPFVPVIPSISYNVKF